VALVYNGPSFQSQQSYSNGTFVFLKSLTEILKKTSS